MPTRRYLCFGLGLSVVSLAALAACVSDDGATGTNDAGSGVEDSGTAPGLDAQTSLDGSVPPVDAGSEAAAPTCDPTADFGDVSEVPGLATAIAGIAGIDQTLDATLTDDEELMLFVGCPAGTNTQAGCAIYEAALQNGTVVSVAASANLNATTAFNRHPTLSADGKRMFMLRGPTGSIYISDRANVVSPFPAPTPVASTNLGSGIVDTDPFFGRSGRLYFMRGTNAVRKLHYVNVANSSITNPTQFHDFTGLDPVMADKDEKLLFLAQLVNNGNAVQRQIRVAELSGATFSALSDKYVKALNDGGKTSNFVNWISKDGCHLYFSRGATINSSFKLYTAKRPTKVP